MGKQKHARADETPATSIRDDFGCWIFWTTERLASREGTPLAPERRVRMLALVGLLEQLLQDGPEVLRVAGFLADLRPTLAESVLAVGKAYLDWETEARKRWRAGEPSIVPPFLQWAESAFPGYTTAVIGGLRAEYSRKHGRPATPEELVGCIASFAASHPRDLPVFLGRNGKANLNWRGFRDVLARDAAAEAEREKAKAARLGCREGRAVPQVRSLDAPVHSVRSDSEAVTVGATVPDAYGEEPVESVEATEAARLVQELLDLAAEKGPAHLAEMRHALREGSRARLAEKHGTTPKAMRVAQLWVADRLASVKARIA